MAGVDRIPAGVSRQLWIEALELAGGDPDRIEVQSAASLVVHNTAEWTAAPPATRRKRARGVARKPAPAEASQSDSEDSAPMATVTRLPPPPQWTSPPGGRQHGRAGGSKEPGAPDANSPAPITKAPAPKTEMPAFLPPASGSQ